MRFIHYIRMYVYVCVYLTNMKSFLDGFVVRPRVQKDIGIILQCMHVTTLTSNQTNAKRNDTKK